MTGSLFDWWPVVAGFTAGLVWLVRLEAKVIATRTAIDTVQGAEVEWRKAHAAEIAPQVKHIDETLARLEHGQVQITTALQDVRERVTRIEIYANGHMRPWDGDERRKGGRP
jgi:hypothetical protein